MKNAWKALASVAVATALVVAPLAATGAIAEEVSPSVEVAEVVAPEGEVAELAPTPEVEVADLAPTPDGEVADAAPAEEAAESQILMQTEPEPDLSVIAQGIVTVTTLGIPTPQDFCFTSSDHYVAPSFPAPGVTYSSGDNGSIIATVAEDYLVQELPEGWINGVEDNTYEYPFNPDHFTDDNCGFPTVSVVVDCETESGVVVTAYNPGESTIGVNLYVDFNLDGEVDWIAEDYAGTLQLAPGDNVISWDLMHEIDWESLQGGTLPILIAWGESLVFAEAIIVDCVPDPVSVPTLFNAPTPEPTCASAAVFDLGDAEVGAWNYLENVNVWVDVYVNEETGLTEVYLYAEAQAGFVLDGLSDEWTIIDEWSAERFVVLAPQLSGPELCPPVPAQFNAPTPEPTCSSAAVFDLAFLGEQDGTDGLLRLYDLENITVGVRTNVPGQVYLIIYANEGYNLDGLDETKWDINGDSTVADRNIGLAGPIGYQNEDPAQPCFFSIVPQPAAPTFTDACGTTGDGWTVPADTDTFTYAVAEDGDTVTVTAVLTSDADEWAEGTVTEWSHTFTNVACPAPALAATGGSDLQPLGWAAFAALLAGTVLLGYRKFASR